jgi:DNA-binding CsgD family transcriptional regulator
VAAKNDVLGRRIAIKAGVTVSFQHLVGREDELTALLRLLEAPDKLPAVAAVAGEAGIGKTTLWLAAAEEAEAHGYLVLSCRPAEAEARFSFVGLADLIGSVVPDVLPQLPRPQRRALETALALAESDVARADERVVAFAFLSTLRTLADGKRLVLAVDDVQWLDAPSLAMLRFALTRLEDETVAAFLTVRDEVPRWLRRGVPEQRLLTIHLAGLSVGALHELLRTRIDIVLPRPALLRIWETSGGNPFFALELARALERRGGRVDPGEELPIPAFLEELVHERLEGLGAAALEVARVVASLAEPTVRLVEVAAGRRAEAGLADALEARILEVDGERVRFTHPLLRSAVSSRATPTQRRSLHARLAELAPATEERARHLALATARPSGEVASVLEDAAHAAHARGAPAASAELAEQAHRLTPAADVGASRHRILFAADHHFVAGDTDRAIALLEQALATSSPGVEHAGVLVHLAAVRAEVVGLPEAIALYHEALAEAEGDHALEATIHLKLADLMRYTESADRGLAHAELAVHAASRVDDAMLRCRALAAFGALHFNTGRGIPREEMEQALALERSLPEWPLVDAATWIFAHQLVWSGELELARRLLDEWLEAVKTRDDPEQASPLWYLSILEWRAGNWELAARYASDSLALREQVGRDTAPARWPNAIIAAHRGEVDAARGHSARALASAEAADNRVAQSGNRWVLGFIELSLGDPAAALEYLKPAWEIREAFLLEPGMRMEVGDTLEALIAVGQLDEAARRLMPWQERARALDRSWSLAILARCRALLLAARGDLAGAFAGFERALAEHQRSVDPFQHARTLLALGTTQRRAKQRGAARATLERALGSFERLGAPLWAAKARAELARIGGRAPSRGELTEGERRIAALVAEGKTNREVAAALFLTEHTVETVLSRAYKKLGVRSRTELAHELARKTGQHPRTNS